MAQNSKIEWTHHTANLWHGCTKVHEGCDNCYAETLAKRWGNDILGSDRPRKEVKSVWNDLKKYQHLAKAAGEIHRVFVGSMMDIFEKPMPLVNSKFDTLGMRTEDLRDRFFRDVIPNSPNLMFLLLTKRPSNINKYIPIVWGSKPPSNVMFGTSISNQENAETLIPQLFQVRGKKFLSIEPQIDFITLKNIYTRFGYYDILRGVRGVETSEGISGIEYFRKIDWVIQGGESGHHKRRFNLEWARSMRDECKANGIPYFFKQIDKIQVIPDDLMIREFPSLEGCSAFC